MEIGIAIVAGSIALLACVPILRYRNDIPEEYVFICKEGKSYHKTSECEIIRTKHHYQIRKSDAITLGYKPCIYCYPRKK